LLGGLNTSPGPAGSVVFGNASAGCDGIFWVQLPHATPGCMVVAPSRCTVLIQNVLLVDWLGVTFTTAFAPVVVALVLTLCANTLWDVWICIQRIIAADTSTTMTAADAIMIEGLVFFSLFNQSV